jgi:hypothetical protein
VGGGEGLGEGGEDDGNCVGGGEGGFADCVSRHCEVQLLPEKGPEVIA